MPTHDVITRQVKRAVLSQSRAVTGHCPHREQEQPSIRACFIVQDDDAGVMDSGAHFCLNADIKGRPTGLVMHADGVVNLPRH